jgi:hypothetical protein
VRTTSRSVRRRLSIPQWSVATIIIMGGVVMQPE